MQLVTEGEVLQLQNSSTAESAGKNRDDRTYEVEHAADSTAGECPNSRLFMLSEFLVATGLTATAANFCECPPSTSYLPKESAADLLREERAFDELVPRPS